jgi:hypothetical protein
MKRRINSRKVKLKVFAIAVLLLGAGDLAAEQPELVQPEYTRTRELPALKISFTDMQLVMDKAAHLLADANKEAKEAKAKEAKGREALAFFLQSSPRETLTLGTGPDEIKIAGHSFPPSAHIPKAAYALSYSYSWTDAPVSTLRLDFGDFTRRLTVSGTSVDQVEAIAAALERDLSQHSAIGGAMLRQVTGYVVFGILLISLVYGGGYCIAERRWRILGIPIFSLLGLVLLFALPFQDLFAGFAVYQGDPSWIVRYAPQLAFAALIIAIAGIPLSVLIPMWLDAAKKRSA